MTVTHRCCPDKTADQALLILDPTHKYMLSFRRPSTPRRQVLLTSSRYNVGNWNYVYDLDAQSALELIEFKESVVHNDLEVKTSLPPELGYLVLDQLVEIMLDESDYEGVMNLLVVNSYYLSRFYSIYFGDSSKAGLMTKFSRLSRMFARLDGFHDSLLFQESSTDGSLDNDDLSCIEMVIQHPDQIDKFHDPWHFGHPQIVPCPPITISSFPCTKIISMGPIKINTVLMANRHYLESISLPGGVLTPNLLKHPFIILALTTDEPVNRVVPCIQEVMSSPSWNAFVILLLKGYGPNAGFYLAQSSPMVWGFSLKEFIPQMPRV